MGLAQCCGYFFSGLLMLLSGIVFICFLLAYFSHIRTFFYKEGTCEISDTIYTIQYSCACGKDCRAVYPCMLIYAKVNATELIDDPEVRWPVVVYDDDWQQIRVLSASPDFEERCSLWTCDSINQENRDEVERYRLRYGQLKHRHKCFYDPGSLAQRGAIFHKRIEWTLVFHVLFWPGLTFILGMMVCAYLCYSRKCRRNKYGMESRNRDEERY